MIVPFPPGGEPMPSPGGNGTIMRTNRVGHAAAGCAAGKHQGHGERRRHTKLDGLTAGDHSLTLMLAALMTGFRFSISALRSVRRALSGVESDHHHAELVEASP